MSQRNSWEIALERIEVGDCWEWTGTLTNNGYGRLSFGNRTTLAHRLFWEQLVGVIPQGLTMDQVMQPQHPNLPVLLGQQIEQVLEHRRLKQ